MKVLRHVGGAACEASTTPRESATESDSKSEGRAQDSAGFASTETLRPELRERLQQLKLEQRESMAKYLVYARALQVLKSNLASRSGSSFASWEYRGAAMLLSTYPPPCVQTSVTSAASWALGLGDRHREAVVTFVVKQLPTYHTQEMFVSELVESGFKGQFDLLYIPCHPAQILG